MSDALAVLGWIAMAAIAAGLAILIAFIASAAFAVVRDKLRENNDQLQELDAHEQAALDLGERVLERIPDPGEEVWLRIRRCAAHPDAHHLDIAALPTLKGDL